MKPHDHIKIQHDIKTACEETQSSLKDMCNWQKEMKEKEKARLKGGQSETSQSLPEVRSKIQNDSNKNVIENEEAIAIAKTEKKNIAKSTKEATTNNETETVISADLTKQNEGDLCKEKGNNLVKLGKHEEALYFYTAAINHFDKEPIYYSNRALCFLKLEKYKECIKDCDHAINLNKTNVKAHYRRMQAYEFLGENEEALKCCQTVLKLDPKNTEAKKSQQRILNRIKKLEMKKDEKPTFTNPAHAKNVEETEMFVKPPHLRSKKPLKKIKIKEVVGGKAAQVHISDEVLDKMFTNNNVSGYEEIKRSNKMQDKASIHDINVENDTTKEKNEHLGQLKDDKIDSNKDGGESVAKVNDQIEEKKIKSKKNRKQNANKTENEISPRSSGDNIAATFAEPTNPAQFYSVWKELSPSHRYTYLQMIPVTNLCRILGAGLEPDTLTDIFVVLNDYYVKDNREIFAILKEIAKHDEFHILSMFLSKDDRDLMKKFLLYMREKNNSKSDIDYIEHVYYLKE